MKNLSEKLWECAEANGPGVYCMSDGPHKMVLCWNPEHEAVIEERYKHKIRSYLAWKRFIMP